MARSPADDTMDDRPVSAGRREEDAAEASLRPRTLADFTGQKASRENLAVFIQAARGRAERSRRIWE